MTNYSFANYSDYLEIRNRVDMWCPFRIEEGNILTVPNIRDTPLIHSAATDNIHFITEVDAAGEWESVGITSRRNHINEPNEDVDMATLQGLEPGLYQCVIVDEMYCSECDEDTEECDHDLCIGWALMKLVEDNA